MTYDFEHEAKRVIEAIEPQRGALMTVLCALREAFEAGKASAGALEVEEPRPDHHWQCAHCAANTYLPGWTFCWWCKAPRREKEGWPR